MALRNFTAEDVERLGGSPWLRARRHHALEDFASSPLPSEKEEVWRYSPIDRLDLDRYELVAPADGTASGADELREAFVTGLRADVAGAVSLVVTSGGRVVHLEPPAGDVDGLQVRGLSSVPEPPARLGALIGSGDALTMLNDACLPDAVVIDVDDGASVPDPVLVVHWCPSGAAGRGPAVFPRTLVTVGEQAQASVVEVIAGPPGPGASLVVPVVELAVGDAGRLHYASLQVLGDEAWHITRLGATAGRDATIKVFTSGLGAAYDRVRTDARLTGAGASSELRSVYLGTGDQIHDVRTQQEHEAPRTTSSLLCKGAVAGTSRSIYSGLIRIRNGAVRSEAMQTNHNLVLDERAHADSVPNLDIEENDVRCSHASTVGPVDEGQRYYLETRGVPARQAEQLIVQGFFDDIVDQMPVPALAERLRREVGLRLADAVGLVDMGGPGASDMTGEPVDG